MRKFQSVGTSIIAYIALDTNDVKLSIYMHSKIGIRLDADFLCFTVDSTATAWSRLCDYTIVISIRNPSNVVRITTFITYIITETYVGIYHWRSMYFGYVM